MNRKRYLYTSLLLALFFFTPTIAAHAEFIFLKDGKIIEGQIIRETGRTITLKRKDDGSMQVYRRNLIMRILYTKLYMGKRFVRLNSGEVLEVYLVDEDSDNYTFRNDINKPAEFKIGRDKVLFMSRSNPTELQGKAVKTTIKIKWYAPYRPPKKYNIYIKEKKGDEYRPAGTTRRTKFTIKNLVIKTSYYIIVTAVDKEGRESLPSNQIKVKTEEKKSVKKEKIRFNIEVRGASFFPLLDFSDRFKIGYGVQLNVAVNNIFGLPFDIGIGVGYFASKGINEEAVKWNRLMYIPPNSYVPFKKPLIDRMNMIPFFLTLEYKFHIMKIFSIAPRISVGYSYNTLWRDKYVYNLGEYPIYNRCSRFEPILMPGLFISYTIKELFIVQIFTEYGMIIESGGIQNFVTAGVGIGFRI